MFNERKSEQAHIPYVPTLLDNAAHNEGESHELVIADRAKERDY